MLSLFKSLYILTDFNNLTSTDKQFHIVIKHKINLFTSQVNSLKISKATNVIDSK